MTVGEALRSAAWIAAPREFAAPVLCRTFSAKGVRRAELAVTALGFFKAYLNGKPVGEDYFRPSASLYCRRDFSELTYQINDEFTYRAYYSVYDVTELLVEGENRLEIALGNGWYRQTDRIAEGKMAFGDALGALYALLLSGSAETAVCSDGTETCRTDARLSDSLFYGEVYDARIERDKAYTFAPVTVISLPETILSPEIAPPDRLIRTITPKCIASYPDRTVYDVGENITGLVEFTACGAEGEAVTLRFSECINGDELDFASVGSAYVGANGKHQIQEDRYISDGTPRRHAPLFVWHGFRYFEVLGALKDPTVLVIHSDTPVTASFRSSDENLNRLFAMYLRTQLGNMHLGYPSDCPHRERLGYTGDGQVCAPAAMLLLDAKPFYEKWIADIFDSQDAKTGHVNHTAPFAGGGGGPGGWGMAAITVPYNYYKIYGDPSVLLRYYDRMKLWVSYLLARMENDLIVREEEGGWCLGDWCTYDATVIPEAFVNTCLFLRALPMLREMAEAIGRGADVPFYAEIEVRCKAAVRKAYYREETHHFADGVQGADAFALAVGLGDDVTASLLAEHYRSLGRFDTGFLCTDLLIDLLFSAGEADVAFALLTSREKGSFGYMWENGATTLWESWGGGGSWNHPMFGACTRALPTHLLGIGQAAGSVGFAHPLIAPKIPAALAEAGGSIRTARGEIAVSWVQRADAIDFTVTLPPSTEADFRFSGRERKLTPGTNRFTERK